MTLTPMHFSIRLLESRIGYMEGITFPCDFYMHLVIRPMLLQCDDIMLIYSISNTLLSTYDIAGTEVVVFVETFSYLFRYVQSGS